MCVCAFIQMSLGNDGKSLYMGFHFLIRMGFSYPAQHFAVQISVDFPDVPSVRNLLKPQVFVSCVSWSSYVGFELATGPWKSGNIARRLTSPALVGKHTTLTMAHIMCYFMSFYHNSDSSDASNLFSVQPEQMLVDWNHLKWNICFP